MHAVHLPSALANASCRAEVAGFDNNDLLCACSHRAVTPFRALPTRGRQRLTSTRCGHWGECRHWVDAKRERWWSANAR